MHQFSASAPRYLRIRTFKLHSVHKPVPGLETAALHEWLQKEKVLGSDAKYVEIVKAIYEKDVCYVCAVLPMKDSPPTWSQ